MVETGNGQRLIFLLDIIVDVVKQTYACYSQKDEFCLTTPFPTTPRKKENSVRKGPVKVA